MGSDLEGLNFRHPFLDRLSPVLTGEHVTLEAGTGIVHTAPGHGQEDYEIGQKYGLDIYTPVDDHGKFTDDVKFFAGMHVFKADKAIIEKLTEVDALLAMEPISHSYPHCWRCKNPVLFRATEQWFISMEKNGLREKALEYINKVEWVPGWGIDRIRGMIESRPDWCISRQRAWGVPITIFQCAGCGERLMSEAIVEHVANLMENAGADIWFTLPAEELLPKGTTCPKCGGKEFKKETDILDVWFDSGVSQAAVLKRRPELAWPADLYLEGSDQHRGWFQSSLLTAVGTVGVAPFKSVLTHGFTVDGEGKKMSKSKGNVIAPQKVIDQYGAEILRLWVSASDYTEDVRISDEILKRLSEAYRRIRNTARYILGNLSDFDPLKDAVPYKEMAELDRWALHEITGAEPKNPEGVQRQRVPSHLPHPAQLLRRGHERVLSGRPEGQAVHGEGGWRPQALRADGDVRDPLRDDKADGPGPVVHGGRGLGVHPGSGQGTERAPCGFPEASRRLAGPGS